MIVLLLFFTVILHNMVTNLIILYSLRLTIFILTQTHSQSSRGEAKQTEILYAIDPLYLVADHIVDTSMRKNKNTYNIIYFIFLN